MIDTLLTSLFVGKRRGQVIEYGIHTNIVSSVMMIRLIPQVYRVSRYQTDWSGDAHSQAGEKKGRQSFQTDALLPKTAATYSPTVTQYHRRDEA